MSTRPWYKRYPGDFIAGTLALSLEEKGAYSMVLDLLYDRGGPIPDDSQWIARVCGCSTRRWNQVRERLIALGKIVVEDGHIDNPRAKKQRFIEEKEHEKLAENGAKGAEKSNEKKALSADINDIAEKGPTSSERPTRPRPQKPDTRTDTGANAPDATASPPAQQDETGGSSPPAEQSLKSRIFGGALEWLSDASGKPATKLRSQVGRWCSRYGDPAVLEGMIAAARASPVEPIAWLEAYFRNGGENGRNRAASSHHTAAEGDGLFAALRRSLDRGADDEPDGPQHGRVCRDGRARMDSAPVIDLTPETVGGRGVG